jgi:hypothetical protein
MAGDLKAKMLVVYPTSRLEIAMPIELRLCNIRNWKKLPNRLGQDATRR